MTNDPSQDPEVVAWALKTKREGLDVWRESMAQLRQLHGDVWNGVRFFLTVNGVIVAAVFALIKVEGQPVRTALMVASLALLGALVTVVARSILGKHRDYYLDMLIRKTLIEINIGLYDLVISNVDLSFPWKVDREFVPQLVANPTKWRMEQARRKGTITRLLFLVYECVIGLHVIILLSAVAAIGYMKLCR